MDPVTRYQQALVELRDAAEAVFTPEVLEWLASPLAQLSAPAELPEMRFTTTRVPHLGGGDPLVP